MNIKKFLVEAILGFILWTLFLSPYVLLITLMSLSQYLSWLGMQAVLVPPLSIIVVNVTNKVTNKLGLLEATKVGKRIQN